MVTCGGELLINILNICSTNKLSMDVSSHKMLNSVKLLNIILNSINVIAN